MKGILFFALLAAAPVVCLSAPECTALIPAGGVYDHLRLNLNTHSRDYLDELAYQSDWGTHQEALAAGVSLGAIIYKQPVKLSGTFDQQKKDEWKKEYLNHRVHDVEQDVSLIFSQDKMNVEVVRIIASCLEMTDGLWMSVTVGDSCHFSVRAGYAPSRLNDTASNAKLTATGAKCTSLPARLPPRGVVVDCVRGGPEKAHVIVTNPVVGSKDKWIDAVDEPQPATFSDVATPFVSHQVLSRGQAAVQEGPVNCPNCMTLYGIAFSVPGKITSTSLLNGGPPFVVSCPSGGVCGRMPRLFADTAGNACDGASGCLVWFAERNHGTPAIYNIDVGYTVTKRVCSANCRSASGDETAEQASFTSAQAEWNRLKSGGCKR